MLSSMYFAHLRNAILTVEFKTCKPKPHRTKNSTLYTRTHACTTANNSAAMVYRQIRMNYRIVRGYQREIEVQCIEPIYGRTLIERVSHAN
jgi:hypothetical protein